MPLLSKMSTAFRLPIALTGPDDFKREGHTIKAHLALPAVRVGRHLLRRRAGSIADALYKWGEARGITLA
jgi:hypothetical protein